MIYCQKITPEIDREKKIIALGYTDILALLKLCSQRILRCEGTVLSLSPACAFCGIHIRKKLKTFLAANFKRHIVNNDYCSNKNYYNSIIKSVKNVFF